jgi:hypothetical protein
MATDVSSELEEIHAELVVAASWLTGARSAKLKRLADQLEELIRSGRIAPAQSGLAVPSNVAPVP